MSDDIKSVIEDWVNKNIKKEFDPIDINDVYAAFEAGAAWQSQKSPKNGRDKYCDPNICEIADKSYICGARCPSCPSRKPESVQ